MNALSERIAKLVALQGPLTVAQFMAMAMHERALGYYASKRDPFGARGDFITAPEISQIFGELLGAWCIEIWRSQGAPSRARLIELGPGRGTLMKDVLRVARRSPEFLNAVEITLVESNPELAKLQEKTLAGTGVPVHWEQELNAKLLDRPLIVLANEFFDALPVRQFVRTDRGWRERMIGIGENGALEFVHAPVPADHFVPMGVREQLTGAIYEISDASLSLTRLIAEAIARHGGAALVIDYGYEKPVMHSTLQALHRHTRAEPLAIPGESDLSAHVDFQALATAASQEGAAVFGPTTQFAFLKAIGIALRAEALARGKSADLRQQIARDVERLVLPDQMGKLFKVLAIMPKSAPPPPGFRP